MDYTVNLREGTNAALIPDHTSCGIVSAASRTLSPGVIQCLTTVRHMTSSHISELRSTAVTQRLEGFQQQSVAFTFLWLSWCPRWHQMKESLLR